MSMLAERKQKQRWSLNPRGKHWSEDVNKFGHKMLEKMGWSVGKGLGANEDGITEHVKVSYKNDAKGMGFKDNGEQWTKHEDNFTSLLANLGSGSEANQITLPTSEKSLEKKSQSSKARVHYKKFTRGKDLAQRSEKDIANIFGRKTLERPNVGSKESKEEISENGTEDKSFGVVTVKAGNMTEYFKSKLGKFGNFSSAKGDYALDCRDDFESEIGACTGFGFASVTENKNENDTPSLGINKINFVSSQNDKTDEIVTEEKTIKKRKRDSDDWTEVESKKKKKSKKKQMAFDNLGSDINPAEEVCYDNPCLKQTDSPQKIENNDEQKKKKRVTFSSPINEILNKSDDSNKTEKSKKKKKNKQLTIGIDNLGCEDNSFEESNQLNNEEHEKKTKKKKKRSIDNNESSINVTQAKKKTKPEEMGIDNLACEEISVNEKNEEIKRYKLKKKAMEHGLVNPACEANSPTHDPIKQKRKSKEDILDDLCFEENNISEDTKVQKKKNKKQKNNSIEISNENISDVPQNDDGAKTKKQKIKVTEENTAESSPKKLKKKSKSKESGIENLGCEINTVEENIASINSEIDSYQTELENEINVKKAKKQKKRDVENPETGQKQNSPNENSKNNTICNNEQSTNDKTNFQKNTKLNNKPFGNKNSGQKIIDNTFGTRNNGFGNRNNKFGNSHSFDKRSSNFNNPQNRFNNGSFHDQRGPNNFNRPFVENSLWKPRFNPNKVDKSSLKAILKPGELKLSFTGSNITKIMGYGVGVDLINKYRPEPETTE